MSDPFGDDYSDVREDTNAPNLPTTPSAQRPDTPLSRFPTARHPRLPKRADIPLCPNGPNISLLVSSGAD
jgi:hypothetical protein